MPGTINLGGAPGPVDPDPQSVGEGCCDPRTGVEIRSVSTSLCRCIVTIDQLSEAAEVAIRFRTVGFRV